MKTRGWEVGLLFTLTFHGALIGAIVATGNDGCNAAQGDRGPKLSDMQVIEASLAFKNEEAPRQPQKERRPPPPEVTPEGVSRDADKKVEPPKKDEPRPPRQEDIDYSKLVDQFRQDDDDLEIGDVAPRQGGAFDGSKHGFADVNKGDPYMRELAAVFYNAWELPTLERGAGNPVGCARIDAEGTVLETNLQQKSGVSNIDNSVRIALSKATKEWNDRDDRAVPARIRDLVTTQWICFTFRVSGG
jgi:hypothetical protein